MEADGAVIRLVTRCTSAEEFIERFARFTTTTDIVVPALPHLSAGTGGHFAICLKDRSVMMQGRCEVTEIQPVAVAPGAARPSSLTALMHLRLREMDAHSCGIHLRLMERRASLSGPPVVREAVPTAVPALDPSAVTVVREGHPPSDTEPTAIAPPAPHETRVPGATFTLPANPLSDLDAADLASFVELTLPETTRADHARRIIRRAAIYASCVIGGLLLGNAFRPDAKAPPAVAAAPIVVQPAEVAPPPTAPPTTAPAPPPVEPASVVEASSPVAAVIKPKKRRVGSAPRARHSVATNR